MFEAYMSLKLRYKILLVLVLVPTALMLHNVRF